MSKTTSEFDWLTRLGGRFIVFDGPDGSGKSSQFALLRRLVLEHTPLEVCEIREPGGTAIGEQIRDVLLDPDNHAAQQMDIHTEMLLFMASRAQVVRERILPALERNEVVMADRFLSSTLAYQGFAGGLKTEDILAVGRVACGSTWPADLVLVFDVDEQTAATRLNPLLDRMEAKGAAFHRQVRAGFLNQAENSPDSYAVLDATRSIEAVQSDVLHTLKARLGGS